MFIHARVLDPWLYWRIFFVLALAFSDNSTKPSDLTLFNLSFNGAASGFSGWSGADNCFTVGKLVEFETDLLGVTVELLLEFSITISSPFGTGGRLVPSIPSPTRSVHGWNFHSRGFSGCQIFGVQKIYVATIGDRWKPMSVTRPFPTIFKNYVPEKMVPGSRGNVPERRHSSRSCRFLATMLVILRWWEYWWQNHYVGDLFNIRHQHRWSHLCYPVLKNLAIDFFAFFLRV